MTETTQQERTIVHLRNGNAWEFRGFTPGGMVRLWGLGPAGGSLTAKPEDVIDLPAGATEMERREEGEDGIRVERVIVTERNAAGQVEREVDIERIFESGSERQTTVRAAGYETLTSQAHERRPLDPAEARKYIADAERRGLLMPAARVPVVTVHDYRGQHAAGYWKAMLSSSNPAMLVGPFASEAEARREFGDDVDEFDVIVRVPAEGS